MNSLKKGEWVPLLNFEGGLGSRVLRSWFPGSWSHFYTILLLGEYCEIKIFEKANFEENLWTAASE